MLLCAGTAVVLLLWRGLLLCLCSCGQELNAISAHFVALTCSMLCTCRLADQSQSNRLHSFVHGWKLCVEMPHALHACHGCYQMTATLSDVCAGCKPD
jgi:hypothetical protein